MVNHRRTSGRSARGALDMDSYFPARPSTFSTALVEETKKLWEPHYGHPLSDFEARELLCNVCNLFHVLVIARSEAKAKK